MEINYWGLLGLVPICLMLGVILYGFIRPIKYRVKKTDEGEYVCQVRIKLAQAVAEDSHLGCWRNILGITFKTKKEAERVLKE